MLLQAWKLLMKHLAHRLPYMSNSLQCRRRMLVDWSVQQLLP